MSGFIKTIAFFFMLHVVAPTHAEVDKKSVAKDEKSAITTHSKPAPAIQAEQGFTCSGKRTCKQMNSCAEAKFYLTQCGLKSLDRDNDGIPCESLCR